MGKIKKQIILALSLLLFLNVYSFSSEKWKFNLIPIDGIISGPSGVKIGWGYTVENNNSSKWLLIYNVNIDKPIKNGKMRNQSFHMPFVKPGSKYTVQFSSISGLCVFEWDPGVSNDSKISGNFIITAAWYDGNPSDGNKHVGEIEKIWIPYTVKYQKK